LVPPDWLHDYQTLLHAAGISDPLPRTRIVLSGADRARFLQGFCTHDVLRLTPGRECEAFITSAQGKVLGHVLVVCLECELVLETVPGQGPRLLAHLDRYLIREHVVLADRSDERGALLLAGARAGELLASCGAAQLPTELLHGCLARLGPAGVEVWIRRVERAGPGGFLLDCAAGAVAEVGQLLAGQGAVRCAPEAWEARRIEAGWPLFGVDLADHNLPQEMDRDAHAISFQKGCYLGQETVARLDALGHVNWLLRGIHTPGQPPPLGSALTHQGRTVGDVTSSCHSPCLGGGLALAVVRRECAAAGTPLDTDVGPGSVVVLPAQAPSPSR
jgi:folate-binding protein YgfZ